MNETQRGKDGKAQRNEDQFVHFLTGIGITCHIKDPKKHNFSPLCFLISFVVYYVTGMGRMGCLAGAAVMGFR